VEDPAEIQFVFELGRVLEGIGPCLKEEDDEDVLKEFRPHTIAALIASTS
jgi:hypothetical protein